jgi:acetoacetyl-CoA reductase
MRRGTHHGWNGWLGESISTKMHAAGYRVVVTHSPSNTRAKDWLGEHSAAGRQFSAYGVDVADIDSCRDASRE